jgi:Putative peptidoglycan binding domain
MIRLVVVFTVLVFGMVTAAVAQAPRIVGLVLTTAKPTSHADAFQAEIESYGAEVLRAVSPNNAQMRALLRRYINAAIGADVALIYVDATILDLNARPFVVPSGTTLQRPGDLLTRALPLTAFSRAAALANNGGVVFAINRPSETALPTGVEPYASAPDPINGTSPVVLIPARLADNLQREFQAVRNAPEVDLGRLIAAIAATDGIYTSAVPRDVMLRVPEPAPEPDPEPAPVTIATALEQTVTPAEIAAAVDPLTTPVAPVSEPAPAVEDTKIIDPAADNLPADTTAPAQTSQPDTMQSNTVQTDAVQTETAPETASLTQAEPEMTLEMLQILERGLSRGKRKAIQRKLRHQKFYHGFIDGIFGPQTRRAIEKYQTANDAKVTGYLTLQQLTDLQ